MTEKKLHLYRGVWGRSKAPEVEYYLSTTREQARLVAQAAHPDDHRELSLRLVATDGVDKFAVVGYEKPVWVRTSGTKLVAEIVLESALAEQARLTAINDCGAVVISQARLDIARSAIKIHMGLDEIEATASALSLLEVTGGRGRFGDWSWIDEPYTHVPVPREVVRKIRKLIGEAELATKLGTMLVSTRSPTDKACRVIDGDTTLLAEPGSEWLEVLRDRRDLWHFFTGDKS